jgi:hypothetical protein
MQERVARSVREFQTAMRVASEKLVAMAMLGGELRASLMERSGGNYVDPAELEDE